MLGPPGATMTVDGHKAWDLFGIQWYLKQNPARDIPFFVATHGGKESGHAIEYGWQNDPKGWAALRDARQPFVGAWGGDRISGEVYRVVYRFPFGKCVPAFSHCSLDSNPGNGDPWGQINGHLAWDPDTVVDEKDRLEITVHVANDAFRDTCTVDITPRHQKGFHPKAGDTFAWTNTDLKTNKVSASGKVTADQWGLVTLKQLTVTKSRNRIRIVKPR